MSCYYKRDTHYVMEIFVRCISQSMLFVFARNAVGYQIKLYSCPWNFLFPDCVLKSIYVIVLNLSVHKSNVSVEEFAIYITIERSLPELISHVISLTNYKLVQQHSRQHHAEYNSRIRSSIVVKLGTT